MDLTTHTREQIIDELLSIENKVDITLVPQLLPASSEDVDEHYQAKLEYNWWIEEMLDEYQRLNNILGYNDRKLFPKKNRRIIKTNNTP